MKSIVLILIVVFCSSIANGCYAAPGFYTRWCEMTSARIGSRGNFVYYCFDTEGQMSMHCEVMASNYPNRGDGKWGAYDIGVVNDGDCIRMYWGPVAAVPAVRCWSYGAPVNFNAHTRTR